MRKGSFGSLYYLLTRSILRFEIHTFFLIGFFYLIHAIEDHVVPIKCIDSIRTKMDWSSRKINGKQIQYLSSMGEFFQLHGRWWRKKVKYLLQNDFQSMTWKENLAIRIFYIKMLRKIQFPVQSQFHLFLMNGQVEIKKSYLRLSWRLIDIYSNILKILHWFLTIKLSNRQISYLA